MTHDTSKPAGETDLLLREEHGPVVILTLNRPQKRNALSRDLIDELDAALGRVATEPLVRSVIITGAGSAFCAGMDLKEAAESLVIPEPQSGMRVVADMQAFADLLDRIRHFPRPVVAALQGDALAGGAGLALACDLVVMASTAMIGYPEVKVGLVAAVVMHDLVRIVGDRRARQLLLTGDPIDATTAHHWGLANFLVAPAHCFEKAQQLAVQLTHGAPQAQATTKRLLDDAAGRPHDLRGAAAISAAVRGGDEAREGIRAFLEKRTPRWEITPSRLPSYR